MNCNEARKIQGHVQKLVDSYSNDQHTDGQRHVSEGKFLDQIRNALLAISNQANAIAGVSSKQQNVQKARQPYFQLNGGAVHPSELMARPKPLNGPNVRDGPEKLNSILGRDQLYKVGTEFLKKLVHVLRVPLEDGLRLRRICQAITSRSTSKPHDEAICIASLLGRKAKDYSPMAADQRMKALLTSLDHVLPEFLFCQIPRYDDTGLRWVPKTLTSLTWHVKLNTCTHCPRDLRGYFGGFRIHPGPGLRRGQPTGVGLLVEVDGERLFIGGGYTGPNLWDERVEREMAVILSELPVGIKYNPYREGCLVTVSSIEDDVIYAIRERNVMVDNDTEKGMFKDARPLTAVRVPLPQQWCVG